MVKQNINVGVDEILDDAGSEPRVYELGFHLDPELPMEEVKTAYRHIREFIESKGVVVAEGEPEKIQLAYTISNKETSQRRDFDSAYFSWIAYETSVDNHAEILAAANADKRVVRFIDLLTTKDAVRHAVEIREISIKTQEREEDQESVASEELDAALENVVV